jgi:hypothetical protein
LPPVGAGDDEDAKRSLGGRELPVVVVGFQGLSPSDGFNGFGVFALYMLNWRT